MFADPRTLIDSTNLVFDTALQPMPGSMRKFFISFEKDLSCHMLRFMPNMILNVIMGVRFSQDYHFIHSVNFFNSRGQAPKLIRLYSRGIKVFFNAEKVRGILMMYLYQ